MKKSANRPVDEPKTRSGSSMLGTPFSATATKALLCGSGELGKEVAIELQRFGVEVIALDRYQNAPAMQVADRSLLATWCGTCSSRMW